MKQISQTILIGLLLCVIGMLKGYAYDFSAVCETGQTLYYTITDAEYHYVQLTCPAGNSGWSGYAKPTGNIILPQYVYDANNNQYFVTSIGDNAFSGCSGLTGNLTIPNSITSIYQFAFRNCSGLTSLTISNSVTGISFTAFQKCTGINQIEVSSQNTVYDSRNNCNAIIKTSTNELVLGCKNTFIPNTVTSIGQRAFEFCSGLTSITIPNSVTSIGDWAFQECNITSITIPSSLTTFGYLAFLKCSCIEQITVEIGNSVYDSRGNCNAVIVTNTNELKLGCKNTIIPNTVTSIGENAFSHCSGLTSITIPNSVTSIGGYAFNGCSSLGSIVIPNSVTSMGNSVFHSCNSLTSATIGNSVTSLGDWAFYSCKELTSITIPNSVTSIGNMAFYYCNKLASINVLVLNPPTLGTSNFFGTSTPNIYVPYESLNAYRNATNWSNYANKMFPLTYITIPGYGEGDSSDKWAFIASPLAESSAPTAIENMITETAYDLYYFDQAGGEDGLEWKNYKAHSNGFTIANGYGYLYANTEAVNLIFKGNFNEISTKTINLVYEAGELFAGWNLVGNPFPMAATVIGSSYYVMNAEGTQIDPIAVSSGGTIAPCTGIMVQATVLGQPITFTRESRQVSNNNGTLQIAVAQTNTHNNMVLDKAIVSFNEGDELGKFDFNKGNAKLYIPRGDKEYAIACTEEQGEMPLNFEAKENGSYTISVNPESVEMTYLHLIDNMTGVDVDILATPNYTFEAKTCDYASRFRLVFFR